MLWYVQTENFAFALNNNKEILIVTWIKYLKFDIFIFPFKCHTPSIAQIVSSGASMKYFKLIALALQQQ